MLQPITRHLPLLLLLVALPAAHCWQEWNYSTVQDDNLLQWQQTWGFQSGPRGRYGHSMSAWGDKVVLFGGRDNDMSVEHTPRTYQVDRINGSLVFLTYDQYPVDDCAGNDDCGSTAEIKVLYNDLWVYELGNECTRYFDGPCVNNGWRVHHPGAKEGGCKIVLGDEVCAAPTERYYHAMAVIDDSVVFVYGGFSERCQDYCDDLWMFDLHALTWTEIYFLGELTEQQSVGNRWKFSMVTDGSTIFLFGGYRLWHGFAPDNSQTNDWESGGEFPKGGFLDDLWVYERELLDDPADLGEWHRLYPKSTCTITAGDTWETRETVTCVQNWPSARAGHASAIDVAQNGMWIYGGYSSYFPYLSTDGTGSGSGTASLGKGGFVPYPGYKHYLDDLWFFSFNDGYWYEANLTSIDKPIGRTDHSMILRDNILWIFGGFADNHFMNDVWLYNITNGKWTKKSTFVYPRYTESCTDDLSKLNSSECIALLWSNDLERASDYPYDVLGWAEQPFYYPDPGYGPYRGVIDDPAPGTSASTIRETASAAKEALTDGTPMVPYAATGPRQYVRSFLFAYNETHNATVFARCTSVYGEPTRGRLLDGQYGRSDSPIFIAQPRRQRPGWDGCRDRADGRIDLAQELMYLQPTGRAAQSAVFVQETDEVVMYGGLGYTAEYVESGSITYDAIALDDMWHYQFDSCINNCSSRGDCFYGFCHCYDGYYGIDCSNTSCPGDYCYYNDHHEQICEHCCSGGYVHRDTDVYVSNAYKLPCSSITSRETNGVCDGFGTCQCAAPFIGDDCSTKDCPGNCTFHGWCSVEYPVSRCMCNPGYFGDRCEYKTCLNNCSYPNGVCDHDTGVCGCRMMYSPFNNTRPFHAWAGDDCSFITIFAAASQQHLSVVCLMFVLLCMLLHID